MKPALSAGAAFAGVVAAGFAAGLWLGRATGQGAWVVAGLFVGVFAGGALAARALLQAGK